MQEFLARHASQITGVLRGPDRMVLRGYLQMLSTPTGMFSFLERVRVPLASFRAYVLDVTSKLIAASLAKAAALKRPVIYLGSAATRKEDVARRILRESPVDEGLICVLKAVEPCKTYDLKGGRRGGRVWLESKYGKCQHLYHYFLDRQFGFMSARIQTWFPFTIQIWINGREWLHRRFIEQGVRGYVKEENCFTRLADAQQAQELFDRLLDTSWQGALDEIAQRINPIHPQIFADAPQSYYWSLFQSEWAVDVMFKSPAYLQSLFPTLARHAITQLSCADVLRYLGRMADGRFRGEVMGDFKSRAEGLRVKHWVDGNSLKAYVRGHGRVLRGEFTMNHPDGFKVYRPRKRDQAGSYAWQPLRKGVADLYRRAQVSDQAVGRYLEGLAAAEHTAPLKDLLRDLCRPVRWHGRRHRALSPPRREGRSPAPSRQPRRVRRQRIPQPRPGAPAPAPSRSHPAGTPTPQRQGHPRPGPSPRPQPHPQAPRHAPLRRHPPGQAQDHSRPRRTPGLRRQAGRERRLGALPAMQAPGG
jgi:hypothetical protein